MYMERALITGATGFVGRYLIDCLVDEFGMEVVGTRLSNNISIYKKAELLHLDILDKEQVSSVLQKLRPSCIFHLAAQSSVGVSWKNPQLTVDVNIKGVLNILGSVRGLDYRPRILLVGSGEEYGSSGGRVNEEMVVKPGNVYAITKVCQNMLGTIYAKAYGVDVVNVRAFNHIGPGQADTFVVSDFCRQVAEIEAGKKAPVMYVGNLNVYRDFTDVRDVVRAYVLLAKKGRTGETYNVGSGHAVQVRAILKKIINRSMMKIKVLLDEKKIRPVDISKIEAAVEKIQYETGWKPRISIDDSVGDVLEWWRKRV